MLARQLAAAPCKQPAHARLRLRRGRGPSLVLALCNRQVGRLPAVGVVDPQRMQELQCRGFRARGTVGHGTVQDGGAEAEPVLAGSSCRQRTKALPCLCTGFQEGRGG